MPLLPNLFVEFFDYHDKYKSEKSVKGIDITAKMLYFYYTAISVYSICESGKPMTMRMVIHDYIKDGANVYFLHACAKQKGKAEKFELDTAIRRAKEANLKL